MRYRYLIFLAFLGIMLACNNDKPSQPIAESAVTPTPVKIPSFDRDSAYQFIADQVAFGYREPNTPAHRATRNYLIDKLESFGAEVIAQDFEATAYTSTVLKGTNIIGQYNPANPKRIVLAAHWDTRHIADNDPDEENHDEPVMGADDGGSGVGVLLEIARQLQAHPIDLGIDIIFFDLEDYGESGEQGKTESWCLGSQYWSRNFHVPNYKANYGILLDMVGGSNARFTKDGISTAFAPRLVNKVWKLAAGMGYGNYFVDVETPQLVDDHYFVNTIAKIPMIDIINRPADTEKLFVEHWHTVNDVLKNIDKRTIKAVGQVVLATIYQEYNGQL